MDHQGSPPHTAFNIICLSWFLNNLVMIFFHLIWNLGTMIFSVIFFFRWLLFPPFPSFSILQLQGSGPPDIRCPTGCQHFVPSHFLFPIIVCYKTLNILNSSLLCSFFFLLFLFLFRFGWFLFSSAFKFIDLSFPWMSNLLLI